MDIQKEITQYSEQIWLDQLPPQEEAFLYSLLSGEPATAFQYDPNSDYSLFLAYHAQKNGFQGYNDGQIRAFQEILRTYKLQKLRKIPVMSKVFRVLNENGIMPVLLKGAAFMCHYAPEIPRMMGDVDLYIPPEQFDRAVSVICGNGFEFAADTGYHIAVTSENLDMDIHRYIYKNGGDIGTDWNASLILCSYLGSKVYVLSPEDMLVHQLVNRGQDISVLSHLKRHFKWIVDCHAVLNSCRPDADVLIRKARAVDNLCYAELTLAKLISLFPERFENTGTRTVSKTYCSFLKHVVRNLQLAKANASENSEGLKGTVTALKVKWEKTRLRKIVTENHKSMLQVMLSENRIHSVKDLVRKAKRYIKKSGSGTEH